MNEKKTQQQERGQSLVLVALAMVGLLAFAGLALDGGLAYATRRVAQNAADSGSIAGTYELYQQKWKQEAIDQRKTLSKIHQAVESHGVPDTDGIAGNEYNENVRAFYVSRGSGSGCSDSFDTDFQELCELNPNPPDSDSDSDSDNLCPDDNTIVTIVQDDAVGISIEVDVPFEPIFSSFIGWDEIRVSNRANNFDQRTAAIVNAGDSGYNSDLWAIFAMSQGTTSGPSTFIEIDPVFQPPAGFAFANVHSQGSFSVGNHDPIKGQVTYCTNCSNCNNSYISKERRYNNINIPDFTEFKKLAKNNADYEYTGDIEWGYEINDNLFDDFIEERSGIHVINGSLTINENKFAAGQNLLIYVTGEVTIDGFFNTNNLSIISDDIIRVNGTLQNITPFRNSPFQDNVAVLWSSFEGDDAINITGNIGNPPIGTIPNSSDIRGAIIAVNSVVNVGSKNIATTVRGSVIGDVVSISSNDDTLAQTRIQYNGNYFPGDPDRIELLK